MRFILDAILTRFLRAGRLTIQWPDGRLAAYGPGGGTTANVIITDWRTVRGLLTNPALVFGEAFVSGAIEPVDCRLEDLLDVLFQNISAGGRHPGLILRRAIARAMRKITSTTPSRARKRTSPSTTTSTAVSIPSSSDRDRQYSCAYFTRGNETLEEAQAEKMRHIAQKLVLDRPDLHVLDIGCGWGGLAITLAQDYGARVTGITLSEEQFEEATARIAAAGLSDRIAIKLQDYRTIAAPFDRIVSVGMFEHVGITHYGEFFAALRNLLTEDGIALIPRHRPQRRPLRHQPLDRPAHLPRRLRPRPLGSLRRRRARETHRHRPRNPSPPLRRDPGATGAAASKPTATPSPPSTTSASPASSSSTSPAANFPSATSTTWFGSSSSPVTREAAPSPADYMSDPTHLPEKIRHLKTPSLSRSLGE